MIIMTKSEGDGRRQVNTIKEIGGGESDKDIIN